MFAQKSRNCGCTKLWILSMKITISLFFLNFFKSLLTVIFQEYQRYQKDLSEVSVQIFRPKFHIFILYRKYFLSRTSKILLSKVLLCQRSSNFFSFLEKNFFSIFSVFSISQKVSFLKSAVSKLERNRT